MKFGPRCDSLWNLIKSDISSALTTNILDKLSARVLEDPGTCTQENSNSDKNDHQLNSARPCSCFLPTSDVNDLLSVKTVNFLYLRMYSYLHNVSTTASSSFLGME